MSSTGFERMDEKDLKRLKSAWENTEVTMSALKSRFPAVTSKVAHRLEAMWGPKATMRHESISSANSARKRARFREQQRAIEANVCADDAG